MPRPLLAVPVADSEDVLRILKEEERRVFFHHVVVVADQDDDISDVVRENT